jgi:tetratricopeptide (TPR) repeat protein
LALDPSSVTGHHWLGASLLHVGRIDEALLEFRLATQLDPLAHSAAASVGLALLHARRFPEAEAALRHALSIDSTFAGAIMTLGVTQTFGGRIDSATRTFERGLQQYPNHPKLSLGLLIAHARAGRWTDASRLRDRIRAPGGDRSRGPDSAVADLAFGDREPLLRLLTSDAGQRRWIDSRNWFGCNPMIDPLWSDERFRVAMQKIAVPACPHARPWPFPPAPRS